jgi:membrane protein DedA with SNARE-associated domain
MMTELIHNALAFIKEHESWAAPLAFLLAFGESLAVISLALPSSAILFGTGALIGAGALPFLPIWIAATLGGFLGDWFSYWVGYHWGEGILRIWPLSRFPALLPKAEAFFTRWGVSGVFLGRFLGPLRATVPLAAGIARMRFWGFQGANALSAVLWAAGLLIPGSFGLRWIEQLLP